MGDLVRYPLKRQRKNSPELPSCPQTNGANGLSAAMNGVEAQTNGAPSSRLPYAPTLANIVTPSSNATVHGLPPLIQPALQDKGLGGSPVLSSIRALSQTNPRLALPVLQSISSSSEHVQRSVQVPVSSGMQGSDVPASDASSLAQLLLPEPTGLTLASSTTTSLHIRWDAVEGLEKWAPSLFWAVEFCKADDTEVLGESTFPVVVHEAPVTGLGPGVDYKIRLRLQLHQPSVLVPLQTSSWTTDVFSTLDVAAEPDTPPKPVVHRISSTSAEVTILASPCRKVDKFYCAESFLLQRLEGVLPEDDSREDEWKSVPEVTCACNHPKFPEIVPTLEKKSVPLHAGSTYHFRVRAINSHGNSEWSEIATILPPPDATEVRVEQVKSLSATLVWNVPDDHGFELQHYHVFLTKIDDEMGESTKETVVPAVAHSKTEEEEGRESDGSPGPPVVYYHPQQLQPNCSYKLYVQAKSEAGMSDPSPEVHMVTQPLPPPLPASVGVEKIESDALDITWSLRDEKYSNVTAVCEVMWREVSEEELEGAGNTANLARALELEDGDNWSTQDIPCRTSPEEMGGDYTAHIIGLRPDNLYAVVVRGRNGGGDGPWSFPILQRTSVPPPQVPTTLYSSDTTSTSTTLSWDQPLDDTYPVTAYQILVLDVSENDAKGSENQDESHWQTLTAVETDHEKERLWYVLEDLEPGNEYSFQLRALNQNGPGEETEPLKVTTKCDVPPPPSQPESAEQSCDSIVINWKPPARDNGSEVASYFLQMRKDLHRAPVEEDWTTVSEEITGIRVEVSCPEPRTVYHFRVRAKNALGYSEWSDESTFETLPPPAPEPPLAVSILVSNNSVTLNWPHQQASITGYEVQQLRHGEWTAVMEAEHVIHDQLRRLKRERRHVESDLDDSSRLRKRPVLAFTRENLAAKTEYQFRVVSKNPGGQAFSPQVAVVTEDDQWARRLTAEEDQQLLELCQSCGCEEYFDQLSRALYDAETLSRLSADELREVLDRLQVLPKHREKLRAALSEPPGAPQKLHVVRCDASFDVLLCSWEPPDLSGGNYPVVEYVVQYDNRSLGPVGPDDEESHEWVEVRCGTTRCRLDNLLASTVYAVRVAACNEPQGQGPWSQEVCVRTRDAACCDTELRDTLRTVLNTQEYADKVAAQLYYEQWTLSSLHSISSSRLEEVLKNMRVKEGAVHALLQFFCTTPRGGSSSWKELTTDSEDNGRGERARRES